jgi:DHA1 family bicyclomycin/chloramphenicol resistance-like MFS transporter
LFLGFAWTAGGLAGKATINRPFTAKTTVNLILQLVAGLLMLLSIGRFNSLFVILFFAFLIHSCAGYTFNNYFTYNLSQFPKNAGIASGLIGGVFYVIVSSLSYIIVGILPVKDERNPNYS